MGFFPQHLQSGQCDPPQSLPILLPPAPNIKENKTKIQDKRAVCPLRHLSYEFTVPRHPKVGPHRRCRTPGRAEGTTPALGSSKTPSKGGRQTPIRETRRSRSVHRLPSCPSHYVGSWRGRKQSTKYSQVLFKEQAQLVEMLCCKYNRCKALLLIKKVFM